MQQKENRAQTINNCYTLFLGVYTIVRIHYNN